MAHGASERLLEVLVEQLRERGLITGRGKQRTDSTHVLGAVHLLNRLELVSETLRAALEDLATVAPEWLQSWIPPLWIERYGRRIEEGRLPKGAAARQQYAEQVGADGASLLVRVQQAETPEHARAVASLQELEIVWQQQCAQQEGTVRLRNKDDLPPNAERHDSPYDPEVRYSTKRDLHWIGYKVHLTETCEDEQVQVLTHVETTYAPVPDVAMLPAIDEALCATGIAPGEHYVDAGYMDVALLLTEQQTKGIALVGPVRPQAEHETLQQARLYQQTEAFRQDYAHRAGVEGTISQGVRAFGLRQARYLGLAKTHLQEVGTAAAINLCRCSAWQRQKPQAKTRTSHLAALAHVA